MYLTEGKAQLKCREQGSRDNQISFWLLESSSTKELGMVIYRGGGRERKGRENKHRFEEVDQGNQDDK